jgi:hypothetical protein
VVFILSDDDITGEEEAVGWGARTGGTSVDTGPADGGVDAVSEGRTPAVAVSPFPATTGHVKCRE